MAGYWRQLSDATSQWAGSLLSYTRNANESISGATVRRGDRRAERFVDWLLGQGHCQRAKTMDELRAADVLREAGWALIPPEAP